MEEWEKKFTWNFTEKDGRRFGMLKAQSSLENAEDEKCVLELLWAFKEGLNHSLGWVTTSISDMHFNYDVTSLFGFPRLRLIISFLKFDIVDDFV